VYPKSLKNEDEDKLLDELVDILFEQWLQEVNQTSYNKK
jgi:hypothetical protein